MGQETPPLQKPPIRCCPYCGGAYGGHTRTCPEFPGYNPPDHRPPPQPAPSVAALAFGAVCGAIVAAAIYVLATAAG